MALATFLHVSKGAIGVEQFSQGRGAFWENWSDGVRTLINNVKNASGKISLMKNGGQDGIEPVLTSPAYRGISSAFYTFESGHWVIPGVEEDNYWLMSKPIGCGASPDEELVSSQDALASPPSMSLRET